ncbi:hypothetical protein ACFLZ7_02655 [Nanoarchaeota archaeon]
MKITIDTRDDKHEIKHLLEMLRAIANESPRANFNSGNIFDDNSPTVGSSEPYSAPSSYSEPSSSESSGGLFNMFDAPTTSTEESKEEENKGDLIDSLRPY